MCWWHWRRFGLRSVPASLEHCKARSSTLWGLCGQILSKLRIQQPCHRVSFPVILSPKPIQLRTLKAWPDTLLSLPNVFFLACYWPGLGCSSAFCVSGSPAGFSPEFCQASASTESLKKWCRRSLGLSLSHFWKRAGILLYRSLRSHHHPLSQTTFRRSNLPQVLFGIASWFPTTR